MASKVVIKLTVIKVMTRWIRMTTTVARVPVQVKRRGMMVGIGIIIKRIGMIIT